MKLQQKLKHLKKEKKALLASNYYNFETCKGILLAAKELDQPIILQLTESSINYMGLKTAIWIGRTLSEELAVESWLHLDHCDEIELIKKCLNVGFDSVMIDASEKSLEENISITKEVVQLAKDYDANVEAELGSIPKLGSELYYDEFTNPDEAKFFVQQTGVDLLAVAIGSQHGFYKGEPILDLERLKLINQAVDIGLALHGGSGIPGSSLRNAIDLGIVKINVATETKYIFAKTLRNILSNSEEIDLRKTFPVAIAAVQELIKDKLHIITGSNL